MIYYLSVLSLLIIQFIEPMQGECSGGMWPIQDTNIGTFTVSWRYNFVSNTVQFIIEGKVIDSINLASTYIAIGWSDATSATNNADIAMFFPGTQTVQDRYSRESNSSLIDSQQDFCIFRTNTTDKNIYVAFERYIETGDSKDINFMSNLNLIFSMGSYIFTTTYNPQQQFFRIVSQTSVNLLYCVSNGCLTTSCTTTACPCLEQITTGSAQCICFPPSSCISGSTITTRTTMPVSTTTLSSSASMNGTCQCVNGGTCLSNGVCSCTSRYRGKFCQINNPCVDYCRNNGNCSVSCTDTSCGSPVCVCVNGYLGVQCETNVGGQCQSNPCVNGNCTTLTNGAFQCQCINGYSGVRCNLISSCLSNPCNQGICITSTNCQNSVCGYSCQCPNGTAGTNCEIVGDPCFSNPCQNRGICSKSSNGYSCKCSPPYGGLLCELIINVCTPNPCLNDGECVRSTNIQDGTYRCNCRTNFVGASCEYLSGCISSQCRNGAQCVSSTTNCPAGLCSATCKCLSGTTGVYCEQQVMPCSTYPCVNGGICSVNPMNNISYCQCPSGTTGDRCETVLSMCTSATCSNNGVCYIDASSGNNTLRCVCSQGFTGQNCQISLNSLSTCSQNPCGFNGTCYSTSNSSYYCICPNGLIGQSCNSNTLTSCSDSPCHYLAKCQTIPNKSPVSYQCVCPDYLTGDRCQYVNNCQKQPCYNQGTCVPMGPQNNFMCLCQPGFGHYDCSIYLGLACNSNVCLNGGTCDYNNANIRCICPNGFTGPRCEWNTVCSSNTCLNGGTCRQIAVTMAECLCATGFTGPTCSLRDSCVNFPCKNGGACTTLLTNTGTNWSAYRCVCPPGIYGQNCDTPISSCANMLCPSNKICSEQPTGPICTCSGNKVGTFCQYDNPCTVSSSSPSSYCLNGSTCVASNTDPPIATCLCREGFSGPQCNLQRLNEPCSSNPCQSRGYCALGRSNTSYSCICSNNYTGALCERSNPCLSSPCSNNAVCQSQWNTTHTWYICNCTQTFTGPKCETSLLNPCGGLCMNGSPCVNGACVCPAQYTGTFCGYSNPCQSSLCRNGGLCQPNYNSTSVSFTCTCQIPYTGVYCETLMTPQVAGTCLLPCNNGGSCVNSMCMCTSQYIGPSCQYENPCTKTNPCLNSGTCFGRYNVTGALYTQCFCLQGYTGVNCETTICSSTSCNGGICTATQNSFICTCPSGKTGDRCQYTDLCASSPCSATERCEQTENVYKCNTCYDKTTYCTMYQTHREYCDNRFTILVDKNYIPVLEACQRSCGQCGTTKNLNDINIPITVNNDNDSDTATYDEQNYTTYITTTTSSSSSTTPYQNNIIFSRSERCYDDRNDCLMQQGYGFCNIFNEKYPNHCINTCNPQCASNL
ncbi:unnamed protein product [Adineta steineri]|uniref:Neurogenic locus notch-like protein n=1 Tax=Adineta steineri TaxID=433720 RepID=A0A814X627_9BILA|nr:unnamed protein product [Adineta steineri]